VRRTTEVLVRILWIGLLTLSIPWTGPAINPHILEHEAEKNRTRETIPPHRHEGVHFEATWNPDASPPCLCCLLNGTGMVRTAGVRGQARDVQARPLHPLNQLVATFRLAGHVAPRAPPAIHDSHI
jgi:hypothetical protein